MGKSHSASKEKKHDPTISYNHKIEKLTKQWKNCPKLQEKITLEKWLEQVKKVKAS